MAYIEQLPATQQLALRDALHAASGLVLRRGGYVDDTGSGVEHPIRTVRALQRAGLLTEVDGRIRLTSAGQLIAEGRA
jgi:hypothetical protein